MLLLFCLPSDSENALLTLLYMCMCVCSIIHHHLFVYAIVWLTTKEIITITTRTACNGLFTSINKLLLLYLLKANSSSYFEKKNKNHLFLLLLLHSICNNCILNLPPSARSLYSADISLHRMYSPF